MRLKPRVPYAVLAVALAGASACGADPAAAPPATSAPAAANSSPASATSPAPPSGATRTIEVSVRGTSVTPAPAQVDLAVGEALRLVVTTDRDNELHAHGFEAEAKLTAGVPTSVTLTGTEPGVFEVETHDPALTLLTVAVR